MMFQDLLKTWREVDAQWRDLYKLCQDKTVPEDRHAVNMRTLEVQEEVLGYAAMALSTYLWGKFSKQTHALHVRVGDRVLCCECYSGKAKKDTRYEIFEYALYTIEDE